MWNPTRYRPGAAPKSWRGGRGQTPLRSDCPGGVEEAYADLRDLARGIQLLNVALGGTLIQDLPRTGAFPPWRTADRATPEATHEIWVDRDQRAVSPLQVSGWRSIPSITRRSTCPHRNCASWPDRRRCGGSR